MYKRPFYGVFSLTNDILEKTEVLIAFSENSFFRGNFVGPSFFPKSISALDAKFGTEIVYVIFLKYYWFYK